MPTGQNLQAYLEAREPSLVQSLRKVMQTEKYKGCAIEKRNDGWYWLGRRYGNTRQEVEKHIDGLYTNVEESIMKARLNR